MTSGPDADLQARLYQHYSKQREVEGNFRRAEQLLTVLLVGSILLVVYATYARAKRNYTVEAFSPHVARQMSVLAPKVLEALVQVGEDVLPVYAAHGSEWFPDIVPSLEERLGQELAELRRTAHLQIREDIDAALHRSAHKLERKLEQKFPGVLTPETMEILEGELNAMLEEDTPKLLDKFLDRYNKDINDLYATLDGFRQNRFRSFDQDRLSLYYVHLWLELLDLELLSLLDEEGGR